MTVRMVASVGFSMAASLMVVGCSGRPSAVEGLKLSPGGVAEAVLSQYDKNEDQQLSKKEAENCPALRGAFSRYDENSNGKIAQDELANRFAMWVDGGVGVTTMACKVTLDGQPLDGALVEFVPEDCFGDAIAPASGTTNQSGNCVLAMDTSKLPKDMQDIRGVQQGLFRIKVTHSDRKIPPRYNTETTLGKELSAETGEIYMELKWPCRTIHSLIA